MTAWSFSRLYTYRQCPRRFKYQALDKIPQPTVPAMERGSMMHKTLEDYIKTPKKRLPPAMKLIAPTMAKIKKDQAPRAELELAFTRDWKPVSWFDTKLNEGGVRIKIDLLYQPTPDTLCVLDYKSGRIKPEEHGEQLRLYKLAMLLTEAKNIQAVTTGVWYIDHESVPRLLSTTIRPSFAATLKAEQRFWEGESKKLVADKKFKATPETRRCAWCPYSAKRMNTAIGAVGPCLEAVA